MHNKARLIYCCLALMAFNSPASAQINEFNVSAAAGISGFKYSINGGKSRLQPGYQVTFGYTYFINDSWGIGTGLELGYYQTKAELTGDKVITTNMVDTEGEGFEHRLRVQGYQEKQKMVALSIPLLVQYQTAEQKSIQWYVKGGFKISIPLRASYKASADEVQASGYYPNVNLEITDLPVHGFGKKSNWGGTGNYLLNPSVSLTAEAGTRFKLRTGRILYAGLFVDYGLNNIKQDQGVSSLIGYNSTSQNESKADGIFSAANTTGNVRLVAYGIRFTYTLMAGKNGQ
jgi:hypothetical protein